MARLTRELLKVFGLSGADTNFAKFGSQVAGAPVKTKVIATIQSLSAWLDGLQSAVVNANMAAYLEDLNAVLHVLAYQIAYVLQDGLPDWNTDTTYYIGSIVKKTGTTQIYSSVADDNAGNALPNQVTDSNWKFLGDLANVANSAFYDRGDVSGPDFNQGMLTGDRTWKDLDLSGIVPVGAKAVLIKVFMQDNASPPDYGRRWIFRKKTSGYNEHNVSNIIGYVPGLQIYADMIIGLDANRFIQYNGATTGAIYITVAGWWL